MRKRVVVLITNFSNGNTAIIIEKQNLEGSTHVVTEEDSGVVGAANPRTDFWARTNVAIAAVFRKITNTPIDNVPDSVWVDWHVAFEISLYLLEGG